MIKHFRVPGLLVTRLEEMGVSMSAVLRRAGLPPDLFQQARVLVTTEELFALWQAIAEVSKDPGIGLALGSETRAERSHPITLAALCTDSFGAAVKHMARYKRLCAPEEILHEFDGDQWVIQFRWTLAVETEPALLLENCFAWVLTVGRQGTASKISPLCVELMQPRSHHKLLERHFGCRVVCGASRNAMVFRREDATLPFVTRNVDLLDLLAPQFDQELKAHLKAEESFVELVRGAIQQRLTGHRPVVDVIARDLHMSSRTLQRKLQDAGSNYQKILDEARHQMARYYLRNSLLELTEAAYLLGYEDANSFARAFRGWEGVAPKHWREANRSEAVN
jgi:AraC-like DNA-binding protein